MGTGGSNFACRIEGFDELAAKLEALRSYSGEKVVKKAVNAGAKIITNEAKKRSPFLSGLTRSAIRTHVIPKLGKNRFGYKTTIGEGQYKGETFYASFLEFGHFRGKRSAEEKREGTTTGEGRDWIPAHPFMRPAFDCAWQQAKKKAELVIANGVVELAKKKY